MFRELTRPEFERLREGHKVYVHFGPQYYQSTVTGEPFLNMDTEDPDWEVEASNGFSDLGSLYFEENTFLFREQMVTFAYNWLDDDTFGFDFGDGDFVDSEGKDYFIHLEYHVADEEWITEIFWDDNAAVLGFEGSGQYLTDQEQEEMIAFAKTFIPEEDLPQKISDKEIISELHQAEVTLGKINRKYDSDQIAFLACKIQAELYRLKRLVRNQIPKQTRVKLVPVKKEFHNLYDVGLEFDSVYEIKNENDIHIGLVYLSDMKDNSTYIEWIEFLTPFRGKGYLREVFLEILVQKKVDTIKFECTEENFKKYIHIGCVSHGKDDFTENYCMSFSKEKFDIYGSISM